VTGERSGEDSKELLAVLSAFDFAPLRTRFRQRSQAVFDFVSTIKHATSIFRVYLFVRFVEENIEGEGAFARRGEQGVDEIEDSRKVLFDFTLRAMRNRGRRVEDLFFEFTFEDAANGLARDFVFTIAAIIHLHPPNFFVDVALRDDFLFRRRRRIQRRERKRRGRRRRSWFRRLDRHRGWHRRCRHRCHHRSSSSSSNPRGASCRRHQRRRDAHRALGDIWRLAFNVERFVPQRLFWYVGGWGNGDAVPLTKREVRFVAQSHQARVEICIPRPFALFL